MIGSMMTIEKTPKILVSVIVPVWNPGPGISRCIESLQNQTLKEIEMIFVDDCGTDDSMDKVRAAAAEDTRIRIIVNEENIGAGLSRNKGIEAARGEYLSFVDPDDYVSPLFLELLYTKAYRNKTDIVKGTVVLEKEDGTCIQKAKNLNHFIQEMISKGAPLFIAFTNEHQSAIYRKELMASDLVRYGTSARGEDSTFLLKACFVAGSFGVADSARYYLCERKNSAMHTVEVTHQDAVLKAIHEQIDFILHYLPGNTWGKEYLKNRFVFHINETGKYEKNPDNDAMLSSYAQGIRSELLRLPYHEQLAENKFTIYALLKHGCLLPDAPYYMDWESTCSAEKNVKLLEQWVDYYRANPKEKDICKKDLLNVLARARIVTMKRELFSFCKEGCYDEKVLLDRQIKRLPVKLRVQALPVELKTTMTVLKAVAQNTLYKMHKGRFESQSYRFYTKGQPNGQEL